MTRNGAARVSWLLTCAPMWTLGLTLPHVRDELRVLLMAVLRTFRRLSMGRPVPHQ